MGFDLLQGRVFSGVKARLDSIAGSHVLDELMDEMLVLGFH